MGASPPAAAPPGGGTNPAPVEEEGGSKVHTSPFAAPTRCSSSRIARADLKLRAESWALKAEPPPDDDATGLEELPQSSSSSRSRAVTAGLYPPLPRAEDELAEGTLRAPEGGLPPLLPRCVLALVPGRAGTP